MNISMVCLEYNRNWSKTGTFVVKFNAILREQAAVKLHCRYRQQTNKQSDGGTNKWTDGGTNGQMEEQTNGQMEEQTNGQMEEQTNGQTEGQTNGQMEEQMADKTD